MQPHPVGGQALGCRVDGGNVALGDLAELVVGQVAVLVVARGGEIGRIDLQHEAGFDDGAVLGLHHIGERFHIGVLARVVQVDDEAREDAGRRRGHEHIGGIGFARRGFEVGDIPVELAAVLVARRADAAGKRRVAEIPAPGEVRMRQQVAPDHDVAAFLGGARVRLDAADPMPDVGGVGRLAHLAVADDIDPGGELLCDDIVDRFGGLGRKGGSVDHLTPFPVHHEIDQRLRPGQAARVRRQDSVLAGFHSVLPMRGEITAMKIPTMIFARAPRCHRGSRRAGRRAGGSPRAWSRRRWLIDLRESAVDRSFRPHPATGASSPAQLRYMPTSALSFLTAFLQAGLF